jgi:hypothetical protein
MPDMMTSGAIMFCPSSRVKPGPAMIFSWAAIAKNVYNEAKETENGFPTPDEHLIFGNRIFFPYDNCGARGYN